MFKDAQQNTNYISDIEVRNVSRYLRRIRVIPPTDKCFSVEYTPGEPIASGLTTKIRVKFFTTDDKSHEDKLVITSGEE